MHDGRLQAVPPLDSAASQQQRGSDGPERERGDDGVRVRGGHGRGLSAAHQPGVHEGRDERVLTAIRYRRQSQPGVQPQVLDQLPVCIPIRDGGGRRVAGGARLRADERGPRHDRRLCQLQGARPALLPGGCSERVPGRGCSNTRQAASLLQCLLPCCPRRLRDVGRLPHHRARQRDMDRRHLRRMPGGCGDGKRAQRRAYCCGKRAARLPQPLPLQTPRVLPGYNIGIESVRGCHRLGSRLRPRHASRRLPPRRCPHPPVITRDHA
mmetsp:Transcript_4498/g.9042  ORF Transcript_4498/g.9042 Transcript_4498/m.9042 type:complete len:267 (-) Transcript_4498:19-819(-)